MNPATKPILEAASEFLWSDELQSSLDLSRLEQWSSAKPTDGADGTAAGGVARATARDGRLLMRLRRLESVAELAARRFDELQKENDALGDRCARAQAQLLEARKRAS